MYCVMNSKKQLSNTKASTGPVPSHKNNAVVVVDFFAKAKMPRHVADICQNESILDASMIQLSATTAGGHEENSDETDSDLVDSSKKKLMSTPEASYIDMSSSEQPRKSDQKPCSDKETENCLRFVTDFFLAIKEFFIERQKAIKCLLSILLAIGVTAYMIVGLTLDFNKALPLLVIWCLVVVFKAYAFCQRRYGARVLKKIVSVRGFSSCSSKCLTICAGLLFAAGLVAWIALDTAKRPHQLISAVGYLIFLFLLFATSKYPDKIIWRPVLWGLAIQIILGVFVLRTNAGFKAFEFIGNFAQTFIGYVSLGCEFVFGNVEDHLFAFKVLPIILYFSSFISVMYYLGAMQWIIFKIAWLMQISLRTSATESLVAAGNIFVGQTESPLLIRPYIDDLTTSELHAVMTAGFGTIAGSVLGAYLSFGIKAVYVITACVMAAPCALAISKLVYPETKISKFETSSGLKLEKPDQRNIIEAAFVGASQAIPLVLNIGANLIAFLSLLAAVNGFLAWFGSLTYYDNLSFQVICSYLFMPLAFLMGVDWTDCFKAAELIGTKIFLNEFIAYKELSRLIENRDNGTISRFDPVTNATMWIDERTEAIVTYALCGFANIGSLGIVLGGLGSMAPKRQSEMAKIIIRALIAGIFVSILNACLAGFLYEPKPIVCTNILNTTNWNNTEVARLHECCSNVNIITNSSLGCNCCFQYNWNATNYLLDYCNSMDCSN